jgi:hypothetical protein
MNIALLESMSVSLRRPRSARCPMRSPDARDGEVVRLRFIDTSGNAVLLRLPFAQAGALTMTLPHLLTKALKARYGEEGSRFVFPLGEWVLEGVADGRTVIVTLRTTDGFEVSFAAPLDRCCSLASDLRREAAEVAAAAPSRTN